MAPALTYVPWRRRHQAVGPRALTTLLACLALSVGLDIAPRRPGTRRRRAGDRHRAGRSGRPGAVPRARRLLDGAGDQGRTDSPARGDGRRGPVGATGGDPRGRDGRPHVDHGRRSADHGRHRGRRPARAAHAHRVGRDAPRSSPAGRRGVPRGAHAGGDGAQHPHRRRRHARRSPCARRHRPAQPLDAQARRARGRSSRAGRADPEGRARAGGADRHHPAPGAAARHGDCRPRRGVPVPGVRARRLPRHQVPRQPSVLDRRRPAEDDGAVGDRSGAEPGLPGRPRGRGPDGPEGAPCGVRRGRAGSNQVFRVRAGVGTTDVQDRPLRDRRLRRGRRLPVHARVPVGGVQGRVAVRRRALLARVVVSRSPT